MDFVNEKLNEFNEFLNNKNVAVIGLGVSNIPHIMLMLQFLIREKLIILMKLWLIKLLIME